jgi:hypothetical protein
MLPPIETLHSPSLDEFRAACRRKQGPFKMTGVVDHWAARERWNPEYFRRILGDKEITATSSEDRSYSRPIYETLTGDEYMDIVEGKTHRKEQVYLAGLSSADHPELAGDYEYPAWVPRDVILRIFVGHDTLTGAHFHPYHQSCLAQLYGEKRIVFHAPGQFKRLYPKHLLANSNNCSRINFRKVDLQQFPRSAEAESLEITLKPGEMVYIPLHWWHTILGLGPNISAAFHWGAPMRDWHFPQPGLRCLFRAPFKRFPWMKELVPRELRNS